MAKLVNALDFDSSIPLFESECRSQYLGVVQFGRTSDLGSEGRVFKSHHSDHKAQNGYQSTDCKVLLKYSFVRYTNR